MAKGGRKLWVLVSNFQVFLLTLAHSQPRFRRQPYNRIVGCFNIGKAASQSICGIETKGKTLQQDNPDTHNDDKSMEYLR